MTQFGNIFSDLKVLDLASYIAGPAATTILSDFGANVIKVAPPPVSERNHVWQLAKLITSFRGATRECRTSSIR